MTSNVPLLSDSMEVAVCPRVTLSTCWAISAGENPCSRAFSSSISICISGARSSLDVTTSRISLSSSKSFLTSFVASSKRSVSLSLIVNIIVLASPPPIAACVDKEISASLLTPQYPFQCLQQNQSYFDSDYQYLALIQTSWLHSILKGLPYQKYLLLTLLLPCNLLHQILYLKYLQYLLSYLLYFQVSSRFPVQHLL